jgi:hypothetical protein
LKVHKVGEKKPQKKVDESMKLSRRLTLESGIHDAPLSVLKNVEKYPAFAIELVYGPASKFGGAAYLSASCDYDEESGSGNWARVEDSYQLLDGVSGGVHIWNVREF